MTLVAFWSRKRRFGLPVPFFVGLFTPCMQATGVKSAGLAAALAPALLGAF